MIFNQLPFFGDRSINYKMGRSPFFFLNKNKQLEITDMNYKKLTKSILEDVENKKKRDFRFSDIQKEAIKFLMLNEFPNDDTLHNYCEKNNMDVHEFEKSVYSLASIFVNMLFKEGFFNRSGSKISSIDPKELEKGIQIEFEHTDNWIIAFRIALDHLVEIPDYYTRLEKLEKSAKSEGKFREIK